MTAIVTTIRALGNEPPLLHPRCDYCPDKAAYEVRSSRADDDASEHRWCCEGHRRAALCSVEEGLREDP